MLAPLSLVKCVRACRFAPCAEVLGFELASALLIAIANFIFYLGLGAYTYNICCVCFICFHKLLCMLFFLISFSAMASPADTLGLAPSHAGPSGRHTENLKR